MGATIPNKVRSDKRIYQHLYTLCVALCTVSLTRSTYLDAIAENLLDLFTPSWNMREKRSSTSASSLRLMIDICLRSVGGLQNRHAAIFNAKALMRKGERELGMR